MCCCPGPHRPRDLLLTTEHKTFPLSCSVVLCSVCMVFCNSLHSFGMYGDTSRYLSLVGCLCVCVGYCLGCVVCRCVKISCICCTCLCRMPFLGAVCRCCIRWLYRVRWLWDRSDQADINNQAPRQASLTRPSSATKELPTTAMPSASDETNSRRYCDNLWNTSPSTTYACWFYPGAYLDYYLVL